MYAPLVLLHATLVLRVLVGDARDLPVAVQVGGVGNIVALLGFLAVAAGSALRGPVRRSARPDPATPATADATIPLTTGGPA
jgi:hypothetical protein